MPLCMADRLILGCCTLAFSGSEWLSYVGMPLRIYSLVHCEIGHEVLALLIYHYHCVLRQSVLRQSLSLYQA